MAEPTVAVCGFGRCGSTMAMQMLAAGGMPVAGPATPPHELPTVQAAWHIPLDGRAVKLLDGPLRYGLPPAAEWRFLWLDRNPREQARSHVKFLTRWVGLRLDEPDARAAARMAASYRQDRARILRLLGKAGPVLVLRYEDVLAAPRRSAQRMRDTLWPDLDVEAAAAAVHRRDGRCQPNLAVEAAYSRAAGGA